MARRTLYVTHPAARIHLRDGLVAVTVDDAVVERLPPGEVERVLVFGHAQVTTQVLAVLLARATSVAALRDAASAVRVTGARLRRLDWRRRRPEAEAGPMEMSGIVGAMEIEGAIGPLLPSLRAAELLHVGSHTSFGLGRIRVSGT